MVAYGEFRKPYNGDKSDERMVLFGLRYIIENYVCRRWTEADVINAEKFYEAHNAGKTAFPFPKDVFLKFIRENNGYFPVKIEALPEGSVIYPHDPVFQIIAEGEYSRLCTFLETILTMVWVREPAAARDAPAHAALPSSTRARSPRCRAKHTRRSARRLRRASMMVCTACCRAVSTTLACAAARASSRPSLAALRISCVRRLSRPHPAITDALALVPALATYSSRLTARTPSALPTMCSFR